MSVIVGFGGGPNRADAPSLPRLSPHYFHDSAAAIVVNGRVACAVEEERLTRVKHTNAFPSEALRACVLGQGLRGKDVDAFAFFFGEAFYDLDLNDQVVKLSARPLPAVRALLAEGLSMSLGFECPQEKIEFVRHHDAHLASVHVASGFRDCLVAVIDGNGEYESASIYSVRDDVPELLHTQAISASYGHFYRLATQLAGFGPFDEYKLMGLAPYGRPERYLPALQQLLHHRAPEFGIRRDGLSRLTWDIGLRARDANAPLDQNRMDFAAGVQRLLEQSIFELLDFWRRETGHSALCLAGGVAHNCAMNGRLARAGMFETLYIHPASHDAGAALGAALEVAIRRDPDVRGRAGGGFSPFVGPGLTVGPGVSEELRSWGPLLRCSPSASAVSDAADMIADGGVVGWARGASEFGPRALGNRSILADPRPAENWRRINLAIKKRESFRPFAPAVLDHCFDEYFVRPKSSVNLNDMVVVVEVKPEARELLAAVTHVDGTARVQVVRRSENPDFWSLISAFRDRTGVGVLLNTSFNNRHEPIVQSLHDGIRTLLTTSLDCLVIEGWVIQRSGIDLEEVAERLEVALAPFASLDVSIRGASVSARLVKGTFSQSTLSLQMYERLPRDLAPVSLANLLGSLDLGARRDTLAEIVALWEARLLELRPCRPPPDQTVAVGAEAMTGASLCP